MKKPKGFTLVEAAVAIAAVAILSGIIIPLLLKNLRDARRARARNDLQVIAGAIASQLKDTGSRRPSAQSSAFNPRASGTGNQMWASRGLFPATVGGGGALIMGNLANMVNRQQFGDGPQSFRNLFTSPTGPNSLNPVEANLLFGFPAPAGGEEFRYKGPYLTQAMANASDPWGRSYLIIGYNRNGMAGNLPIWVVCAGESGTILRHNLTGGAGVAPLLGLAPRQWDYTGPSSTNIVLQVH
jgi:prepilin-type N-terminal cleavage/methylation domain-containing protein